MSSGSTVGQLDREVAHLRLAGQHLPTAKGLYVPETPNQVSLYDLAGSLLDQFGGAGSGLGQFNFPGGSAVDAGGNLYVADVANHRVQKLDPAGAPLAVFGSRGRATESSTNLGTLPSTARATCTWRTAGTTASRSSPPTVPSSASGEASAAATASSRTRPAWRSTRVVTSSCRTTATTASRSSTPTATSSPSGAPSAAVRVSCTGRRG